MFLVDGYVHGTWALTDSTLVISPFRPLPDAQAVQEKAARLAEFIAPGAAPGAGRVSVRPAGGTGR